MSSRMEAVIERRSPNHYRATLNGRQVGTFRTEREARAAIIDRMAQWYGLVPTLDADTYIGAVS